MIHILTIHFKSDKWIDLQLSRVNQHIKEYKVWAYCDKFNSDQHEHKFHFCGKGITAVQSFNASEDAVRLGPFGNHWVKLNSLTKMVLDDEHTKEDDLIIWLDSDAFPVNDVDDYLTSKLDTNPFLAIVRTENANDVIPHPSFACTTVEFCRKHNLDWRNIRRAPNGMNDVGGYLYKYFEDNNIDWFRLRRTESLTEHPVFFTIYDNLVYHHGAGSRPAHDGEACCRFDATRKSKIDYDETEIFKEISKEDFDFNEGLGK